MHRLIFGTYGFDLYIEQLANREMVGGRRTLFTIDQEACIAGRMAYGTVIKMCDKLSLNPVDFSSLERDASLGAQLLENRVMQNYVKLNQTGRDKILELMDDFVQIDKYKAKAKKTK